VRNGGKSRPPSCDSTLTLKAAMTQAEPLSARGSGTRLSWAQPWDAARSYVGEARARELTRRAHAATDGRHRPSTLLETLQTVFGRNTQSSAMNAGTLTRAWSAPVEPAGTPAGITRTIGAERWIISRHCASSASNQEGCPRNSRLRSMTRESRTRTGRAVLERVAAIGLYRTPSWPAWEREKTFHGCEI